MLKANKASNTIFVKYSNYIEVFLFKLATKFLEYIGINNYTIKLKKDQQLFYGLIYSLVQIELEILKAYIKLNLGNEFSKPSTSLVKTPIFLDYKFNRSLYLYINYYSFNNLTIKN